MNNPKENASGKAGASRNGDTKHLKVQYLDYTEKSTDTIAQRQRILKHLRAAPHTTEQFRRMGIYWAPARIFELRQAGYEIKTELIDLYDQNGYSHIRCARYTLIAEV